MRTRSVRILQKGERMKRMVTATIAALTALAAAAGCAPSKAVYTNPVFSPVFADPCIIRGDDGFYAYATEDFGCFGGEDKVACIPIVKSPDMVHWEYVGDVFPEGSKPAWGTSTAGAWAPDVVKIGDKYNLYYSLSVWNDKNPGIGVAVADHPAGPWTDMGMVLNTETSGVKNSIDSFTFVYGGGVYMIWGSFYGIYMVELSADGLRVKDMNTKTLIGGTEGSCAFEGSYMIERGGSYYLFLSLGHCCEGVDSSYYTNVVKADSPFGPWVDRNGRTLLGKKTLGELVIKGGADVTGTGHNAVIQDDAGDYWIVYHGYEVKYALGAYGSSPRRSLFIDKLLWDGDGFPYVEGNNASYKEITAPAVR